MFLKSSLRACIAIILKGFQRLINGCNGMLQFKLPVGYHHLVVRNE